MWPALIKRLQSGIIIPYYHYKQKRNETKWRRKNKGFAVFRKNAAPNSPEAVICLVVLLPVYTGTK